MQPGAGKAQRGSYQTVKMLNLEAGQGVNKMEPDSSQSCPVTGQEAIGTN